MDIGTYPIEFTVFIFRSAGQYQHKYQQFEVNDQLQKNRGKLTGWQEQGGGAKTYTIVITVGADRHVIDIAQGPAGA
ncbi:hypothetical protein AC628_00615 [Bradyrhizobium sp. NAS96.2]|nr:hypothetical protein AC628_00615 [Bradyrhizobium sp. NAS96.2]